MCWRGAAFGAALFGLLLFVAAPRSGGVVIAMTALYGALAYILYSIAVAHANDHARAEDFVKVSGGLLLLYGFGTMAGPVIAARLMDWMRPESIFLATALAHFALAGYAMLRVRARAPVPIAERDAFTTQPSERAVTPAVLMLDPRAEAGEDTNPQDGATIDREAQRSS
jgi:MFS family permease